MGSRVSVLLSAIYATPDAWRCIFQLGQHSFLQDVGVLLPNWQPRHKLYRLTICE